MKKTKLKLEDLKVQSFVTSMEKTQKQTIDGGATLLCPSISFLISASINITSKIIDAYNTWAENQLNSTGCAPEPIPMLPNGPIGTNMCTIGIANCPM